MSSIVVRVSVVLRRFIVRIGVERTASTAIVGIVKIEVGTVLPSVVLGFDLTSTSVLLVAVCCRCTYTLAMVIVVIYFPSVLWSTTIFTFEHVKSGWAFFFVRIVAMPSVTV